MTLEEIAPGIDPDKDIYSKMSFVPNVGSVNEMDERIFNDGKMEVRKGLLDYLS